MNNEPKIIITPVEKDEKLKSITTIKPEIDQKTKEEDFVTGLPEWDLTPPYEVIRRVNRK